jgi:hypothetical protein
MLVGLTQDNRTVGVIAKSIVASRIRFPWLTCQAPVRTNLLISTTVVDDVACGSIFRIADPFMDHLCGCQVAQLV